ncbi:DUF3797 domain-containing protein [Bacillus subtilis]|nr:DUF3797 domain-containing protein [Bacillus subtilis]MDL2030539.1 DUF3797 domain-containing protein [Bacillus subtilis]
MAWFLLRYKKCRKCGNKKVGGEEGTFEITDKYFKRTCKCGFSITLHKHFVTRSTE